MYVGIHSYILVLLGTYQKAVDAIHRFINNNVCLRYECFCFITYSGGPCTSNPCLNVGTCTNEDTKYICSCGDDYSGQLCESKSSVTICHT